MSKLELGGGGSGGGYSDAILTINDISPDGDGNFSITGSGGINITSITNGIEISTSSSGITFYNVSSDQTISSNAGYFVTDGVTLTLPSSPSQGDVIIIACDTSSVVTLQLAAGQYLRLSNQITSSGGTCSSSTQGDSLTLYYRSASSTWWAFSTQLTWDLN